ncbi:hypothetical protein FH972_023366 [Carpinus fangiana]|uniref:Uncharacterized protein n=1 Tax=Carpinus fangiana TaxID=176857 RepID=A0A5N6KV88_9ROSI|nr:hypothetical protein FH972_023366 [Carpinus fangiana]
MERRAARNGSLWHKVVPVVAHNGGLTPVAEGAFHGAKQRNDLVVACWDVDANQLVVDGLGAREDCGGVGLRIDDGGHVLGELVASAAETGASTVHVIGVIAGGAAEGVGLKVVQLPQLRVAEVSGLEDVDVVGEVGVGVGEVFHLEVGEASSEALRNWAVGTKDGRHARLGGGGRRRQGSVDHWANGSMGVPAMVNGVPQSASSAERQYGQCQESRSCSMVVGCRCGMGGKEEEVGRAAHPTHSLHRPMCRPRQKLTEARAKSDALRVLVTAAFEGRGPASRGGGRHASKQKNGGLLIGWALHRSDGALARPASCCCAAARVHHEVGPVAHGKDRCSGGGGVFAAAHSLPVVGCVVYFAAGACSARLPPPVNTSRILQTRFTTKTCSTLHATVVAFEMQRSLRMPLPICRAYRTLAPSMAPPPICASRPRDRTCAVAVLTWTRTLLPCNYRIVYHSLVCGIGVLSQTSFVATCSVACRPPSYIQPSPAGAILVGICLAAWASPVVLHTSTARSPQLGIYSRGLSLQHVQAAIPSSPDPRARVAGTLQKQADTANMEVQLVSLGVHVPSRT